MFSVFRDHSLVGVEINADEIRLLQIKETRKGLVVENFGIKSLPSGAVVEGRIIQVEVVAGVLTGLVRETHTAGCVAAVALPVSRVISKRIKLPADLPVVEYEAAIVGNFKQYFPGMQEELCFDYVVFDPVEGEQSDILLVVSRVGQLNSYRQVVEQAGLVVKIVDIDTYALARAASFGMQVDEVTALLDISAEVTQFILLQHGQIIFNQHWHASENSVLSAAMKRAMHVCAASHKTLKIKNCLVSGNFAVASALASESDMHFVKANPFSSILFSKQVDVNELHSAASRLMVCYGLAAREVPVW